MKLDTDLLGWGSRFTPRPHRPAARRPDALAALRRPLREGKRAAKPAERRRARIEAGIAAPFRERLAARSPRILSMRRIVGTPVFDAAGEPCGRIADLSIDKVSGRIVYALVGVEGGFGFLTRLYAAPWALLRYDARLGGYVAPADKLDVANGPAMTPEELQALGAGDDSWRDRLAIYASPYLTIPFI